MSARPVRPIALFALALSLCIAARPAGAVVYDANADFVAYENANSGPAVAPVNGVWSYGTKGTLDGTFNGYTVHTDSGFESAGLLQGWQETDDGVPALMVNVGSTPSPVCCGITAVDPGQIFMHPDPGGQPDMFTVLRFTAPSAGSFTAAANFEQLHSNPATTYLRVAGVVTDTGAGTSTLTEAGSIAAGQTIDFIVGPQPNGDYGSTSTGLFATIDFTPVPEPASAAVVMIAGAAALLARRRVRN